MRSLAEILNDGGFFTEAEALHLAPVFPDFKVGIRFGCSERVYVPLSELSKAIKKARDENPADYVRDVFFLVFGPYGKQADILDAIRDFDGG
jgi:hypothetical protein